MADFPHSQPLNRACQPPETCSEPPAVVVAGLVKRFGNVIALDRVNLTVRRGEFFSLLGPSGCGKTTLLRVIAGLEQPDAGALELAGRDVLPVPAHRRPVNTVFQNYALFPHLSVADNVSFGLRMKRVPPAEGTDRSRRAMELAQIADLAERMPAQLSGGQKQRVALARALVNEPAVLLLDEPLGALDLKLRQQLQTELRALQRRLGITFIHVTHDQTEALALSDRLAVMHRGRIEQVGEPTAVYERPRTRFVADFLGACNLIPGRWQPSPDGPTVITEIGRLVIGLNGRAAPATEAVTLAIRPERIRLAPADGPAEPNSCAAVVESLTYVGAETRFTLRAGRLLLTGSRLNDAATPARAAGEMVRIILPPAALVVLED